MIIFSYYEIIDSVMGTNPTISPHYIIDSGAQDGLDLDDEEGFLLVDDNVCATSPVQASSSSKDVQILDDSCDGSISVSVAKEKGTANRRQNNQEKRKRKRPRAAAIFEDIATTIETSLSSMEDRFAAII